MPNRNPWWMYPFLIAVIVSGLLYAAPNLYQSVPAVQVSGSRGGEVGQVEQLRLESRLALAELDPRLVDSSGQGLMFQFENEDTQLRARELIRDELGDDYAVALNLAHQTPQWMRSVGALPMYLGLDLRGGVHFLLQVDMDGALDQAEKRYRSDLRDQLRRESIRHRGVRRREGAGLEVLFATEDYRDQAYDLVRREFNGLAPDEFSDAEGRLGLRLKLTEDEINQTRSNAIQQNITTLRSRVNLLGVAEPVIQQQGADRVVVQLPGVQDTAEAKRILGAIATLEFRLVSQVQEKSANTKRYPFREGGDIYLERNIMLTGDHIIDATEGFDQQNGSPAVFITLDGKGATLFARRTGDKIGRSMASVFIDDRSVARQVDGELKIERKITESVINAAVIQDQLGKRFQITGLDSTQEARELALLLRAGALAAPIYIVEERTVGPTLGRENIKQGRNSVVIGFVLVLIFMAVYYRLFGVVANLALTLNLVLILAALSLMQATLTLPGIAGIVLTTGMAVDANVLIFERIREELRNGYTPQASIHRGYEQAFSTITDANITTFIAAIVLFAFGTGPVKGFAVTLSIGILTSMFTAILGTRTVINLIYGGRKVERLAI